MSHVWKCQRENRKKLTRSISIRFGPAHITSYHSITNATRLIRRDLLFRWGFVKENLVGEIVTGIDEMIAIHATRIYISLSYCQLLKK